MDDKLAERVNTEALQKAGVNIAEAAQGIRRWAQAMQAVTPAIKDLNLPRSTNADVLIAMNAQGKHIYAGTVPGATVAQRREANRRARRQRRVNRLRNFRRGVR